jgi:NitT/TauT family transport system ATP-binding protein
MTLASASSQVNARPPAFVHAQGISKTFASAGVELAALCDLSLRIDTGESLSILGPSGCGKSTLLRLVAGILQPSSGELFIDGLSPSDYRTREGVGFVFQRPLLFPWRTLWRNVLLPSEIRMSDAPTERASHLLELLGLDSFRDAHPHQLSGGMLQRAALARALVPRPRLLLLDEPFSALDELTRERLWIDFAKMWRQETATLILVTHSVREAAFFGDRVAIMSPRPGRVLDTLDLPARPRDRDFLLSNELSEACATLRRRLSL